MTDLAGFVALAIVVITPGPDTALTIRNTLLGAVRQEWRPPCVALGQGTWPPVG